MSNAIIITCNREWVKANNLHQIFKKKENKKIRSVYPKNPAYIDSQKEFIDSSPSSMRLSMNSK